MRAFNKIARVFKRKTYRHDGYCPICETSVVFSSTEEWFRDHLFCSRCGSIPRERALMKVIFDHYPDFRNRAIHESSPSRRGASVKLKKECRGYSASQFYPDITPGQIHPKTGCRCENLEQLSYPDNSFDIVITQDVMEHIFHPKKAFKEIARILRPGGAHIFTVPLINKTRNSECRASKDENGETVYHRDPEYHSSPADRNGALVTMHWGYDIAAFIDAVAATPTEIITIDNVDLGIRAEYIDVLVSVKN